MSFFKSIPDESSTGAHFTKRKIRKIGDSNLLQKALDLLAKFEDEGDEMLIGEMGDLVDVLHRSAIIVQRSKQEALLAKLRKHSRKKFTHKR